MQITVTITGDALSPEITKMLSDLGVVLGKHKQDTSDAAEAKTVEVAIEPAAAKRTRAPKAAKPEPQEISTPEETTEETDDVPAPTLESLRKTIVDLAKGGKSAAVGKALKEVAPSGSKGRLQDVAKEDYAALAEKLAAI